MLYLVLVVSPQLFRYLRNGEPELTIFDLELLVFVMEVLQLGGKQVAIY